MADAAVNPSAKKYTLADLEAHKEKDDCFLLIDGKVYDVTKFLDEHPGGDEVVLAEAGKDATEAFNDIGHSDEAREQLKGLYVGEFDGPTSSKTSSTTKSPSPSAPSVTRFGNLAIPLVAISGYLIWRFLYAN